MKFSARFRIEKSLGQGQFGEIWKAYDQELKTHVALKVASGNYSSSLEQEIKTMKIIT